MKNHTPLLLCAAVALLSQAIAAIPTQAKKITITERQQMLEARIDKFQHSGELTLDEATAFRNKEAKILEKEAKMQNNNGGKISYRDETTLENDFNKLSDAIQKKQLQKRVVNR